MKTNRVDEYEHLQKSLVLWRAFIMVHWFLTGNEIIASSSHPLSMPLYNWFLDTANTLCKDNQNENN